MSWASRWPAAEIRKGILELGDLRILTAIRWPPEVFITEIHQIFERAAIAIMLEGTGLPEFTRTQPGWAINHVQLRFDDQAAPDKPNVTISK